MVRPPTWTSVLLTNYRWYSLYLYDDDDDDDDDDELRERCFCGRERIGKKKDRERESGNW